MYGNHLREKEVITSTNIGSIKHIYIQNINILSFTWLKDLTDLKTLIVS